MEMQGIRGLCDESGRHRLSRRGQKRETIGVKTVKLACRQRPAQQDVRSGCHRTTSQKKPKEATIRINLHDFHLTDFDLIGTFDILGTDLGKVREMKIMQVNTNCC